MRKALGLTVLLAALLAVTALWESSTGDGEIKSLTLQNIRNVLPLIGLYGFLSLGQALVIITGGIDLSVGSVVALVGIIATMGMRDAGLHPALVIPGALGVCVLIGAWHGLLVTKMRIQPFVVTLCGLFFYRGVARVISGDSSRGFGSEFGTLRQLGRGFIGDWLPIPFVLLLVAAAGLWWWISRQPEKSPPGTFQQRAASNQGAW